jgi:AcrR family transcriptional regulator
MVKKKPHAPCGARERILSTAKNLFSQQGFHPTSIRDIAAAAHVNSQLIYYYFGGKSGLRRAVLEDAADRVYALLQDARRLRGSSLERLRSFIVSWAEITLGEAQTIRMLFRLAQEGDPSVASLVRGRAKRNVDLIRELLRDGMDSGEFRSDVDPRLAAASVVGMVFFAATSPVLLPATSLQGEPKLVQRFAEHTADMFLNGITRVRRSQDGGPQRRRRT